MNRILSICRALSDRNRLRVVAALAAHEELCACQLSEMLAVSGATASRHMAVLVGCGLVDSRKAGRWVYYKLKERPATGEFGQVLDWLQAELGASEEVARDMERLRAIARCSPEEFCRLYRGKGSAKDSKAASKALRGGIMAEKSKILFLCTGNSCRSQMAEGWARHLCGEEIEPYSAGIQTHGLNSFAVKVMAEAGVDISAHRSKHLDELKDVPFAAVVTVCDHAHEHCPLFPGKVLMIHAGFDDPPRLARAIAAGGGSEEQQLECYRRVRGEIRDFVKTLPERLELLEKKTI